jgi:cob(I)alamin adenosyltransferase
MAPNQKRHSGMFKPGQSGNPLGRPKTDQTLKELAKTHTQDALETLRSIMLNPKAKETARVHAATALLDRGWGKPAIALEAVKVEMNYLAFLNTLSDEASALLEVEPELPG